MVSLVVPRKVLWCGPQGFIFVALPAPDYVQLSNSLGKCSKGFPLVTFVRDTIEVPLWQIMVDYD